MRYLFIFIYILTATGDSSAGTSSQVETGKFGMIKGEIVDYETKSPIPGASVQIENTKLGTSTDDNGHFVVRDVPVGNKSVRISSLGYQPKIVTNIIVRPKRITFVFSSLSPSALKLHGVKVNAGYFDRDNGQLNSMTSFSAEEIRRAPGSAGDVSRIVSVLPSIAHVNDMFNALAVRGGSPAENAFYVDNIEIPNINHFPLQGNSGGPIGLLNVDFVRSIKFSAGGFGASYGEKLSSVMEIELRDGNKDEFDAALDISVSGYGLILEGPIVKDKGAVMFSVRRSYLDLLVDAIGSGVAPRFSDYQGKISYRLGKADEISILGLYGIDQFNDYRERAIGTGESDYGRISGNEYAGGVNWLHLWSGNGYSKTSLSTLGTRYRSGVFRTLDDSPSSKVNSLERAFQIRNVNHIRLSRLSNIEFGLNAKYYNDDQDYYASAFRTPYGHLIRSTTVDKRMRSAKLGTFFSVSLRPTARLATTLGLRYDYYGINGNQHVSPRLSVSYDLSSRLALRSSFGIYHQPLPLFIVAQKEEFENLSDLSAIHYVVGFDYLLSRHTKLTVEAYRKDYSDFPTDPAMAGLFLVDASSYYQIYSIFRNLVDNAAAKSVGIELTLQKKLVAKAYVLVSGSVSKSTYRNSDGVWRDRIGDNRFVFNVQGGYKPNDWWEFSLRWIYAGGSPYTPINIKRSRSMRGTWIDTQRINESRFPAYHSLNLRIDRRFYFGSSNLTTYFSVLNAYNRENV
ncbi:MAG: TonB-dependent receptor domain-containing protein, partial [Candidatus Zixiibacteriota bacterium]